jgi:hypothetical protein
MLSDEEKARVTFGAMLIRQTSPEASLDIMKQTFRMVFPNLNEEEVQEAYGIIEEVFNASMN